MDVLKMKAKGCIIHVITKHNTNTQLYITLILNMIYYNLRNDQEF